MSYLAQSSWKAHLINRAVKQLDSALYAFKDSLGVVQVLYRDPKTNQDDFVLALTDNWQPTGQPVDYGTDYVVRVINYKTVDEFDDYVARREWMAKDKRRQKVNNLKAVAADSRREFAKATNDINTSTLSKEKYNGNR